MPRTSKVVPQDVEVVVLGPAVGLYMSPRAPIEFQSAVLNQPVIGRHLGICTTAMRIDGVGVGTIELPLPSLP